jgi:hypothetical protein
MATVAPQKAFVATTASERPTEVGKIKKRLKKGIVSDAGAAMIWVRRWHVLCFQRVMRSIPLSAMLNGLRQ